MTVYVYSLKSSQTNDKIIEYIESKLKEVYSDIRIVSYDDFFKLDFNLITLVIFSGGDGIFNHMVNCLVDYPNIIIGYIPTGTANDMARVLKIKNYKDALDKIRIGNTTEYNLLEVKDNNKISYFNYALCFGGMSSVSNDAKSDVKKKLHKFDYILRGCKKLFCKREKVIVTINDKTYVRKVRALIVFRSKTLGGYRVSYRKCELLRVSFIKNIFDLGFMFILGIPFVRKCSSLYIKSNSISSIDGEKANLSDCCVKISDKKIKIIA